MEVLYRLVFVIMLIASAIPVITSNEIIYAVDWIDDEPDAEDEFFQETEEKVEDFSSSLYTCVLVCVISIGAFALLGVLIKLASKKSQIRDEAKEHIIHIMIGLVAVFGITLFAFIARMLGNSLKF